MPALHALVLSISDSFAKIVQLRETLHGCSQVFEIYQFSQVYQDSRPAVTGALAPKANNKLEILFVKLVRLKQKTNQMLRATIDKIRFRLFKKITSCSFRYGIAIEKCKAKTIQVDSRTFRYIQAYSDIFRHNQDLLRKFRILVYLEPWHTQSLRQIQITGIFIALAY